MRVWTVSEAKAGTLTQCLGVARLIDPKPKKVIVKRELPAWRQGLLSPYRRRTSPDPHLIISCGGKALSHAQTLAASCAVRPFTVHLAMPQPAYRDVFDMAFVSRHDLAYAGPVSPNIHEMTGVPHQIFTDVLDDMRVQARPRCVPGGGKVVTILAGGPNRAYLYDDDTTDRLIATVQRLAEAGWTALVSTSRRSRPDLLERLLALRSERIIVWDKTGENPYRDFLAAADALLVTKDSITMACEAVTTGKPTYIFDLAKNPSPRLDKFEWFHRDMSEALGLTRPFQGELLDYTYTPLAEATRIANSIRENVAQNRPDLLARAEDGASQRLNARLAFAHSTGTSEAPSKSYAKAFKHHHRWLAKSDLLGRPWFVLGSAPQPTIPRELPARTVYAYIKFAGRSARMHGLPPGDITLLTRWKELQRAAGLDLRSVLKLRPTLTYRGWLARVAKRTRAESELTSQERDDYIVAALGTLFSAAGQEKRPSNGIAMICFALAHGVPLIVISGLSFDVTGHEYERSNAPRRHAEEDQAALRAIAAHYPFVSTTEEGLHRATGLPLHRS